MTLGDSVRLPLPGDDRDEICRGRAILSRRIRRMRPCIPLVPPETIIRESPVRELLIDGPSPASVDGTLSCDRYGGPVVPQALRMSIVVRMVLRIVELISPASRAFGQRALMIDLCLSLRCALPRGS